MKCNYIETLVILSLTPLPKSIISFQLADVLVHNHSYRLFQQHLHTNTNNAESSSSSLLILHAKQSKTKNKKSKKGTSSTSSSISINGFGVVGSATNKKTSSKKSNTNIELDRSSKALSFYSFLNTFGAGDNLKRVGLAYLPLSSSSNSKNGEKPPEQKIRGVIALKPIQKNDVIFSIPYDVALSLGREGKDPTIPAAELLQNYLCLRTEGVSTKIIDNYKPYLDTLPEYSIHIENTDYQGCTDFFSDEALHELQCPYIMKEVLKRRDNIKERYENEIQPKNLKFHDGTDVTEDHLKYAVWLITSRILNVQGNRLMIPYIDMCNHNRKSLNIPTGKVGGELKIIAGSDIQPGSEITICYEGGVGGNDRFIQDYGFLDYDDGAFDLVVKTISKEEHSSSLKELEGSSFEEDEELLKNGLLSEDVRCAIRFRMGVKKALERASIK